MSMTTPPGWYPDPGTPTVERWWDGTTWTGHTRPAGMPTQPMPLGGQPPKRTGRVVPIAVAAVDGTTPEAIAKADIEKAADQAYGTDFLGNEFHGGITSHKVLAQRSVVVAGRTGYLVRWQVTTGEGDGGYVQSVAFPAPMGSEVPVVVRFAFSAGPKGPPLALMDEVMKGIRPIGSSTGGGVGSSIGPDTP